MDKKSRSIVVGILAVIAFALGLAVLALQDRERDRLAAEYETLKHAIDVLEQAPGESLNMYYETRGNGFPAKNETDWAYVHARALFKSERIPELAEVYRRNPALIQKQEDLSIRVYEYLSTTGRYAAAGVLRDHWREQETDQLGWLTATITGYVYTDELASARGIALTAELREEDEVHRQLLLTQLSNQQSTRIEHLDAALLLDPSTPDVREARALQLESENATRYALYEYKQALQLDPQNPERAHALAEFLVRNRQSRAAINIWEAWADTDQQAYIRTTLWGRLIRPTTSLKTPRVFEPDLELIVETLAGNTEPFFNSSLLDSQLDLEEVFWITLLQKISNAQYEDALAQMNEVPIDSASLNPIIFTGFHQALNHRAPTTLNALASPITLALKPEYLPFISRQLQDLARADENRESDLETDIETALETDLETNLEKNSRTLQALRTLLDSDQIFTAVALAGGWTEAALNLSAPNQTSPRWLQLQWINALMANRTSETTLEYVESLKPWSDGLEVIAAQLYLKTGKITEAEEILGRHATSSTMAGIRAADLSARLEFERKAYNTALKTIIANPAFSMTVPGHELVARIYIDAGANERAVKVLSRITQHSTFAKEFIAAESYRNGEYTKAKDHLVALILEQPERTDLRESLLQVGKAEQKVKL